MSTRTPIAIIDLTGAVLPYSPNQPLTPTYQAKVSRYLYTHDELTQALATAEHSQGMIIDSEEITAMSVEGDPDAPAPVGLKVEDVKLDLGML